MFLLFGIGFSQTPISLETAMDKAFQNNLNIKNGNLRIDFQSKLQNSAAVSYTHLDVYKRQVDTRVLPGSNLKTSTEAVLKSQQILLKKFPEIEKIVGKTGSSEIPTDPMPIDASDMMIILKPRAEWTSAHSYEELSEKMSAELKKNMLGVTYSCLLYTSRCV